MNTIDISLTRDVRRLAAVVIVVALALSVAALVALGAEASTGSGGIFASLGDYLTDVGEALASE
jgi:hypothetical protein